MARTPIAGRLEQIAGEINSGYTRRDAIKRAGIAAGGAMVAGDDDSLRAVKSKHRRGLKRHRGRGRRSRELGEWVFWQQCQEIAVH